MQDSDQESFSQHVQQEDNQNHDDFVEYSSEHDFENDLLDDDQLSSANELNDGVDDAKKQAFRSKLETDLLFHVQELGGLKMMNLREIYEVTPFIENGLKDILKYLKEDDFSQPYVKLFLFRWNIIKSNLIPLILTQRENKSIFYKILMILAFLLEPTPEKELIDFKFKEEFFNLFSNCRENFVNQTFLTILVDELSLIIKNEQGEQKETHQNIVEFIVTIFRNILVIPTKDEYFSSVTTRLLDLFSLDGGVFDAIVYLTQDINSHTYRNPMLFTQIISAITKNVDIKYVVDGYDTDEIAKRIKEISKIKQTQKRAALMSSRHSRFGAMLEVKDKNGKRTFLSNPKMIGTGVKNEVINKFKKPKPRFNKAYLSSEVQNFLNEKTRFRPNDETKKIMRTFFLDFLKHSIVPLIDSTFHESFESASQTVKIDEFSAFFELLSFGLKCGMAYKPTSGINFWLVRCVGIVYIDIAYRKLTDELSKKKKEANYLVASSCYEYLYQVLRVTKWFSENESSIFKQNAKILEKILFTKDFTKVFRDLFELFGNRPPKLLILGPTFFYGLLANFGKNKILTLKTQKVIEDDVPDYDEENEDGEFAYQDRVVYKERRFNYITEISAFVNPTVIAGYLDYLSEEKIIFNTKEINRAILNFLTMVIEDLSATWSFYQMDFLQKLEAFITGQETLIKTDELLELIKKKVLFIFSEFHKACLKNTLLPVESLFRFRNYSEKENILNNYTGLNQIPHQSEENHEKTPVGQFIIENQAVVQSSSARQWSYDEDLFLIEKYYNLSSMPNSIIILTNLLNSVSSIYRNTQEIADRISKLGLLKSNLDLAKNKLELKKKSRSSNSVQDSYLRFFARIKHDFSSILLATVESIKLIFDKFETFKNLDPDDNTDFSIVPDCSKNAQILSRLDDVFDAWGFIEPKKGQLFWRIPYYSKSAELNQTLERFLDIGERHLNSQTQNISESKNEKKNFKVKKVKKNKRTDDFIVDEDDDSELELKLKKSLESSENSIVNEIESDESDKENSIKTRNRLPAKTDNLFAMMTGVDPENCFENEPKPSSKKRLTKIRNIEGEEFK